jgi:hypothetical protein
MRIRTPKALGAAVLVLLGSACNIEDSSSEVTVQITSPDPIVVRGDRVSLQARAFRVVGVDTFDIKNVRFQWATDNPSLATVAGDDYGGAELTGVNAGSVAVSATAVAFDASSVGFFQMRVAEALEVDSVRPTNVKWGDRVRVYGVGVRNIFVADLVSPLFPDTLRFQGDPQGLGVMEFWVPPPARTQQMFVLGPGVFFTVPESTFVDTVDVYEYNDTLPSHINLDGTPPYPQVPSVLFYNPALAFEQPPRTGTTSLAFDWYRFTRTDVSRPLTFVLRPQNVLADSTVLFTVLGDSILYAGFHTVVNPTWFITTQGRYWCNKGVIDVDLKRPDSLIVALKRRPLYTPGRTDLHVLSFFAAPQRHAIAVVDDYLLTDPRIPADRFEENDICNFADTNFNAVATQIHVNTATTPLFQDSSLTIDNPHDIDWYKFRVTQQLAGDSTMIRVRSRPFPGAPFDRSDIDLYIVNANTFGMVGVVSSPGSADSTRLLLPSGDYYLVVFDYAGEATRYSLCIRVGFLPCAPLVNSVESAATESAVRAAVRGPDRARSNGATKTGWAATRTWAQPPHAVTGSPLRRP